MFCRMCGNQMNDERFCSNCGYDRLKGRMTNQMYGQPQQYYDMNQNNNNNVNDMNNVNTVNDVNNTSNSMYDDVCIYQVKPHFIFIYEFSLKFMFGVLISLLVINRLLKDYVSGDNFGKAFLIASGINVLVSFVLCFFTKIEYDKVEYNFYNKKLQYKDGFLDEMRKEIKYENIKEIEMGQGFFGRMLNIGTLYIKTNATIVRNDDKSYEHGGICINCVKDITETYAIVRNIINK